MMAALAVLLLTLFAPSVHTCSCTAKLRKDGHDTSTNKMDAYVDVHGAGTHASPIALVPVRGGTFFIGTTATLYPEDGDTPPLAVHVEDFEMQETETTVAAFRLFVDATGYVTDAERFGWSGVMRTLLRNPPPVPSGGATPPWWVTVDNATWAFPLGPHEAAATPHDAVAHISYNDAWAYCRYFGLRLPNEAEWERAALGAGPVSAYPWGDELKPQTSKTFMANTFTGRFPDLNTAADGFLAVAPVKSFAPHYGLYDMIGNLWEWVADEFHTVRLGTTNGTVSAAPTLPVDPHTPFVMKGGSYMCHRSYCARYKVSSRSSSTSDTSLAHLGFRCAR